MMPGATRKTATQQAQEGIPSAACFPDRALTTPRTVVSGDLLPNPLLKSADR
jgi:hypothetical protein